MKSKIFALIFTLFFTAGYAQKERSWSLFPSEKDTISPIVETGQQTYDSGTVLIIQDVKLDELMKKYQHNHQTEDHIDGFRIQVFSSSGANSRLRARTALIEFNDTYPEILAYLKFESPNFQILVGDFRNRYEAEKVLVEIKPNYSSAFIKSDIIALPPIKDTFSYKEK